jgi:hypothetical protein
MRKIRQQFAHSIAIFVGCVAFAQYAVAAEVIKDFPTASPESVGVDSKPLVELSKYIGDKKLDIYSFLVVKDGNLIFERYGNKLTRNAIMSPIL